jgi:hypothetical protein
MDSFKSAPLTSLLLIVLLGSIAAVLIAPQIDLPDTAFQRNSSPLAIHAQSHQVAQTNSDGIAPLISFRLREASEIALNARFGDSAVEIPSVPPPTLRC